MAIHAHKLEYSQYGVEKKEFAESLQRISDQLRWIDQKLQMKVENKIADTFYEQQHSIKRVQLISSKLKTVQ
ncbi:hypothetical protein [Virgibacillus oceani]|uniref:Uncharacterized protein n=1 Tax=Virgibacillus oceani TaxID=1479511 RepID=A0A917H3F6_9BACI|nr:hypothetical protein [Virgibacillus oceani]GGG65557.1 hypothetical protein GCM10011398_06530 [Virgibacillus oceani]